MSGSRLGWQLSDLFAYVLIPGISVVLPVRASRWLIRKASGWRWLMAAISEAAWQGVQEFVDVEDEATFKRRLKQVEMLDVRDLYLITFGRGKAVMAEVQVDVPLELVKDRVIIGMHWGPSVSILRILSLAGMQPALPFRPPDPGVWRVRPFYQIFSIMAGRYMVGTLGDRAVPIGGAAKVLRGLVDQPGSILVVIDAPPLHGRPILHSQVLGKTASFNAGFPLILAETEKEYVFYAISLKNDDSVTKILELDGPYSSSEAQEFLQRYSGFLDKHLGPDPAQWRIWHVAKQFWH